MSKPIDTYTIRHLNEWLDKNIDGYQNTSNVREKMIAFISDDPEYWGEQSWWNVYDKAKCLNIDTTERQR